jgi:molecular chaperone DnaJ
MPRDYYEVLSVGRDAQEGQIKKAFRRLARELHPDQNQGDPETEERFKELAQAYEVLSDPEKRRMYDAYGHEGLRGGQATGANGFGSMSDIFSAFFGGGGFESAFGGGSRRGGPAAGGDVAVGIDIDLTQAAFGASVEVGYEADVRCGTCHGNGAEPGTPIITCERCGGAGQVQSVARTPFGQMVRATVCDVCEGAGRVPREPCETCHGRGMVREARTLDVDIPPGIEDGQRIRLSGRAHAGAPGGPAGDLYVIVQVRPDERFLREGDHLVTVVDVPAPLAALGTTLDVPTLDGSMPTEIAPGTQPGEVITLSGEGMPRLRGGRRGDLQVVVNVTIPRKLDREQRDLLERFAETLHDGNAGTEEGMLAKLRRLVSRA